MGTTYINLYQLDLTLFLPALSGISPLIVYHVTTLGRNRVKSDSLLKIIILTIQYYYIITTICVKNLTQYTTEK